MTDKPDNYGLPRSWMVPYEPPSREGERTFAGAADISVSDIVKLNNIKGPDDPEGSQKDGDTPAPFKSRFSQWIRTVALILVLIFLPEQVSWAFNYNPLTLWGQKDQQIVSVGPEATPEEIISARIAGSINHLLKQVAYKENTRVQLQLTNDAISNPELNQISLFIDSATVFTKNRIRRIIEWLQEPDIHPLNCGVYALRDILASYDVDTSLEELSVSSLMVDLMNDIVKPGEAKLKTSLFAINKVIDAYGLGLKPAKLAPADVLKLQTPFIANFESEHFVTVNSVDDARVYFSDIGLARVSSIPEFTAQLTGFVLAPELEKQESVVFEYVPDSMTPFIWGNKWVDKSDELPGLMSTEDVLISVAIQVVAALILPGAGFAFSIGVSSFAGTMGEVAVMKWGWSEDQAMILTVAISVGANMGASAFSGAGVAAQAGKDAVKELGKEATKELVKSTYRDAVKAAMNEMAKRTSMEVFKQTLVGVAKGAAIGVAMGYVKVEIAKALDDMLSEDMNGVIRDGIIGIVSSIGASLAVAGVTQGISSAFKAGTEGLESLDHTPTDGGSSGTTPASTTTTPSTNTTTAPATTTTSASTTPGGGSSGSGTGGGTEGGTP
ncbi:MAG: hypothetical protein KAR32_14425, partial [Candidatus Omnitrophica bacterium]|nr:hypothetical protein [Candidatus Omnitrophota bacterium]